MTAEHDNRSPKAIADQEVEDQIRAFFKRNYDLLRQEGGHVLAESTKEQALQQVLHYWRKLKAVATTVTDTEVKLSLPGQVTPKGRSFVIEGVVDIVREGDLVRMYDLKTHEDQDVRAERDLYEAQLNVYAHIWKGIRGQPLNETAVIATRLPLEVREAIRSGDPAAIAAALAGWEPIVDLPFDEDKVQQTIEDFGRCVDAIEDGEFSPPPPEKLREVRGTRKRKDHGARGGNRRESALTFAQANCQSCDARFSCSSYRAYQKQEPRSRAKRLSIVRDEAAERELDAWIEENLAES
jgi:hypothetical protein